MTLYETSLVPFLICTEIFKANRRLLFLPRTINILQFIFSVAVVCEVLNYRTNYEVKSYKFKALLVFSSSSFFEMKTPNFAVRPSIVIPNVELIK